jgi:hypothetical protein
MHRDPVFSFAILAIVFILMIAGYGIYKNDSPYTYRIECGEIKE